MTKHENPSKTLGPRSARLVTALHERGHVIFTLDDARKITGLKDTSARTLVHKLVGRGVATRLRPGVFQLVPPELGNESEYLGDPYVVARALMGSKPYYLSCGSAMDIHNMVTQPQLDVYVTSPKVMRRRTVLGTEFRFIRCKPEHFFGTTDHWVNKQEKVLVSDLERHGAGRLAASGVLRGGDRGGKRSLDSLRRRGRGPTHRVRPPSKSGRRDAAARLSDGGL